MTNYYDISPRINEKLGVFPGDQKYQRHVALDFQLGHHLRLSSITSTLHIGAHADSSGHYHQQGSGVDQRPLMAYIGQCQVIRVAVARGQRIQPAQISQKITQPRVLLATGSFPDPYNWNSDFCSLSPELILNFHQQGVQLVGIDTPSVDPQDSKKLESHQALYQTGMCVLEGLVLEHVPEGCYFLSALPLNLEGADAAPVRAVLFQNCPR